MHRAASGAAWAQIFGMWMIGLGRPGLAARACAAVFALCSACGPASSDEISDFYRGKQIRSIIGSDAGGGHDIYARTVARHLGEHIPGNPTIIPQNMNGAGSRVAANWVYNLARRRTGR